jgi:hypothetical protein
VVLSTAVEASVAVADVEARADPAGTGRDIFVRSSDLTRVVGARVVSLNSLVPDATRVLVARGDPASPVLQTRRPDDVPLTVVGGEIDLGIDASGDGPLLGVYEIHDETPIRWPMPLAPSRDLRLSEVSKVVIANRRESGGSRTILTVVLSGLNPLIPDGTPVSITLRLSDGSAQIIASDPSQVEWTDSGEPSGLRGGRTYKYGIGAVRRVIATPLTPGSPPRELYVQGDLAGPVEIRAIDRTTPSPPTIANAGWVTADGSPAAALTEAPVIRLTLRAEGDLPGAYSVQRRSSTDSRWFAATLDQGRGWLTWPNGTTELAVTDPAADPALAWSYRAQIELADGRRSPMTDASSVDPLRPGQE